jgi:hypothetical protein
MKIQRLNTQVCCAHKKKIYRLYQVRVTWPNGNIRYFPSEEHAKAFIENREPNFVAFKTS